MVGVCLINFSSHNSFLRISPVAEVNSHITGTSYNTQIAIWIFNASDPRSNTKVKGCDPFFRIKTLILDQGSADPRSIDISRKASRTPGAVTAQWTRDQARLSVYPWQ